VDGYFQNFSKDGTAMIVDDIRFAHFPDFRENAERIVTLLKRKGIDAIIILE